MSGMAGKYIWPLSGEKIEPRVIIIAMKVRWGRVKTVCSGVDGVFVRASGSSRGVVSGESLAVVV